MAIKCKNVFSAKTLEDLNKLNVTDAFDKNVETLVEQFRSERLIDSQDSAQIVNELKLTQASDIPQWRNIVNEKYPESPTAFEFILNETVDAIHDLNKKEFNKKLPAIVNSVKTANRVKETRDWFLSKEFEKAQKSVGGFWIWKNAIKKAKDGDDEELMFHIFMGLLANNNFQKGIGFEDLRGSNMARYYYNGVMKTMKDIDPKWWVKLKEDDNLMMKFYEDRQNIARTNGRADKSLSDSNTLHWKTLVEMKKHFKQIQKDNNVAGGDMNFFHFADRVAWNPLTLKHRKVLVTSDDFVNEVAQALDPINLKQLKKYENLTFEEINKLDQNIILDELKGMARQIYESTTNYSAIDFSKEGRVSSYLLFKDGASEFAIRKKYTTQDPVNAIYTQFMRFSEENAVTRLYGKNLQAYFKELKDLMSSDPMMKKYVDSDGYKTFISHLRATQEPSTINKTQGGRFFTTLRNINVGHLGFIPMDQTLVEPFFAISRMNRANKKWFRNMKTISGHHPLLTSKENRNIAEHWGMAVEHIIGMTQMRLYNTMAGTLAEGKFQGYSEKFANGFMRYNGSTWLSDGQAAGGLSVLRSNVTSALDTGASWKTLSETNPDWIRELQRHGFTEQDYAQTLQYWKKKGPDGKSVIADSDGKIDIFLLANKMDEAEVKIGGLRDATLYDKWHKFFNSNVDGLSRIKPGDTEKMRLSFYMDDSSWSGGVIGGILKTITQFKSFSFAVGRRMHGKEMQDGGMAGLMSAVGSVLAYTFVGSVLYTQAKEVMNGNAPYSFFSSRLYERALTRMPILGNLAVIPFTEMLMQNLIRLGFDQELLTAREFKKDAFRQFLGPVTDQLLNLTSDLFGSSPSLGSKTSKLTKDLVNIFFPTILGINFFKYYLTDTLEEALDPDAYYRRQMRKDDYAEDERIGRRHKFKWERVFN
jgi:hypothetical protein